MKSTLIFLFLALTLVGYGNSNTDSSSNSTAYTIKVKIFFNSDTAKEMQELPYQMIDYGMKASVMSLPAKLSDDSTHEWQVTSQLPILFDLSSFVEVKYRFWPVEPGDSIIIHNNYQTSFSGRGSEKLNLIKVFSEARLKIEKPSNPVYYKVESMDDYLQWERYFDSQEALLEKILYQYKDRVGASILDYIKANFIAEIEYERILRFATLGSRTNDPTVTTDTLLFYFENSLNNKYAKWLRSYTGRIRNPHYFYEYVRQSMLKKFQFNWDAPEMKQDQRKVTYFGLARSLYSGYPLMACLTYLLTSRGLKEHTLKSGYSPEIDSLLKVFYLLPGFPEYKKYVLVYQERIYNWLTAKGTDTYDFLLQDANGQVYKKNDFQGKIIVLNFDKEDCAECVEMHASLRNLRRLFSNDSNIVFLSVTSGVRDQVERKYKKKYDQTLHFIVPPDNVIFQGYNVQTFPRLFVIDQDGRSMFNPDNEEYRRAGAEHTMLPDPRLDNGKGLVKILRTTLQMEHDGPYVFIKPKIQAIYPYSGNLLPKDVVNGSSILVETDIEGEKFETELNYETIDTTCEYPAPSKLLVLSDIEGNFSALRRLLRANHVIDSNYNWMFGNGHVVFNGDMFDRGKQVTQCLWLLNSLETKARKAGGRLHFVLGNHEIMNLLNDTRYNDPKYNRVRTTLKMRQSDLFGDSSYLGKWLSSKNILLKVGDLLFVHGGISAEVISLGLSIDSINVLFRKGLKARLAGNDLVKDNVIFNSRVSPFWFRGYYSKEMDSLKVAQLLDGTLRHFKVSHIITGHTIMADEITSHHGGRLINVDTKHAKGKSEALFVDKGLFIRVDASGNKNNLKEIDVQHN